MVNKNNIRVFVYGTLKVGHGLHKLLSTGKNVEYMGRHYIEEPLMLCDMGAFPALVRDEYFDKVYRTYGELYSVDPETLASLDFAEGHPRFFKREKVSTAGPNEHKCWVYILSDVVADYAEDVIEDGVWCPSDEEAAYVLASE